MSTKDFIIQFDESTNRSIQNFLIISYSAMLLNLQVYSMSSMCNIHVYTCKVPENESTSILVLSYFQIHVPSLSGTFIFRYFHFDFQLAAVGVAMSSTFSSEVPRDTK